MTNNCQWARERPELPRNWQGRSKTGAPSWGTGRFRGEGRFSFARLGFKFSLQERGASGPRRALAGCVNLKARDPDCRAEMGYEIH